MHNIKTTTGVEMQIETFVFFDLETTGLIRNTRLPRVTELALVATSRHAIKENQRNKLYLPRVLHKLVLPVNPRVHIPFHVSNLTDLWNDDLESSEPFNEETFNVIQQFIERLPPPICFVAHNGKRFDYPIFLNEFRKLNKVMSDDILCVDTLELFKHFLKVGFPEPSFEEENFDVTDNIEIEQCPFEENIIMEDEAGDLDDDWNDALCSVLDNFSPATINGNKHVIGVDETDKRAMGDTVIDLGLSTRQAANEKTPKSQTFALGDGESSKICLMKKSCRIKKKLNFVEKKLENYKLSSVYKYLIGCDPLNSHSAEDDCISMLRCVCQLGHDFSKWADENKQPFNIFTIESMT